MAVDVVVVTTTLALERLGRSQPATRIRTLGRLQDATKSILDDITDEEIIALVARVTDERRRARETAGGP